ncbi:MAG: NAD-dependent epimerase/dehydratase family protein [Planctomycetota bacterium]
MRIFLTGGTGFLGAKIAEACVEQGYDLRVLVEPHCCSKHLEALQAEVCPGDLRDQPLLRRAVDDCDLVIHSAAKVGDWGDWPGFYEVNVLGARRLYEAAEDAGVKRAVHVSSTAVYGKDLVLDEPIDETMGPLPVDQFPDWYAYGRSKSMAESLVWQIHERGNLEMTAIRPGWVYGPGDVKLLGRLASMLERGNARLIGRGNNPLMLTYVTNVADAILLAARHEAAAGEAFNVSNDVQITQREFFDQLAETIGVQPVRKQVPFRAAYAAAAGLEASYRWLGIKQRPPITRQSLSLLGLPQLFSTDKIRAQLGWQPRVGLEEGLQRIGTWWSEFNRSSHDETDTGSGSIRIGQAA